MLVAIIAYVGLAALFFFVVLIRREVLLLTGTSLLVFHITFVVLFLLIHWARGLPVRDLTPGLVFLVPLAISFALRGSWILLRYAEERASVIIEESCSRVRIDFQKTPQGYHLSGADGKEATLRIIPLPVRSALLSFEGQTQFKKVDVLRNLLRKNFANVLPRLVIHL